MGKTFLKSFMYVTICFLTLSCSMFNDNCTDINHSLPTLKSNNSQTRTNISSSENNFLVTLNTKKEVAIKEENINIPDTHVGLSKAHTHFFDNPKTINPCSITEDKKENHTPFSNLLNMGYGTTHLKNETQEGEHTHSSSHTQKNTILMRVNNLN